MYGKSEKKHGSHENQTEWINITNSYFFYEMKITRKLE